MIEFKDLPSTETPINASNLNKLQSDIKQLIDNNTIEINSVKAGVEQNASNIESMQQTTSENSSKIEDIQNSVNENIDKITTLENTIQNLPTANDRNFITATLSANHTKSAAEYEQLDMAEYIKIGNKLTSENGAIKIGNGVSYVKASFHAQFQNIATAGPKWATLYKNSDPQIPIVSYLSNRGTITSAEMLLAVSENDILSLQVNGVEGDLIRSGAYTALTIEVIV